MRFSRTVDESMIEEQIAEIQKKISELKSDLKAARVEKQKLGDPKLRFFDWMPINAARSIIVENGEKIKRTDLVDIMVAGGLTVGKKRNVKNIKISIDLNIEIGNLIQKGEYIDIP